MPSNSVSEEIEDRIERGQKARGALRVLGPFLNSATETAINTLCGNAGKMSDGEIRIAVGELVGLRKLKSRLESDIKYGEIAGEKRGG